MLEGCSCESDRLAFRITARFDIASLPGSAVALLVAAALAIDCAPLAAELSGGPPARAGSAKPCGRSETSAASGACRALHPIAQTRKIHKNFAMTARSFAEIGRAHV